MGKKPPVSRNSAHILKKPQNLTFYLLIFFFSLKFGGFLKETANR